MDGEKRDSEASRGAAQAGDGAAAARKRAREARERASRVRERRTQISQRLYELSAQIPAPAHPTSAEVVAAEEALRHAAHAAERARQLALEAFEHAAMGEEGVASNHDIMADGLEERAREAPSEQRDLLLQRAAEHRAKAEHHRQEATVDRDGAEKLRRETPESGGDGEPVAD